MKTFFTQKSSTTAQVFQNNNNEGTKSVEGTAFQKESVSKETQIDKKALQKSIEATEPFLKFYQKQRDQLAPSAERSQIVYSNIYKVYQEFIDKKGSNLNQLESEREKLFKEAEVLVESFNAKKIQKSLLEDLLLSQEGVTTTNKELKKEEANTKKRLENVNNSLKKIVQKKEQLDLNLYKLNEKVDKEATELAFCIKNTIDLKGWAVNEGSISDEQVAAVQRLADNNAMGRSRNMYSLISKKRQELDAVFLNR